VARVVAVDNEQYVATIRGRFGIHLEPGAGVWDRRASGFEGRLPPVGRARSSGLGETFDVTLRFGILHRVEAPLPLLRVLGESGAAAGRVILETHGVGGRQDDPCGSCMSPADLYARYDAVYTGFGVEPRSSMRARGPTPV
jgi:hypothetical protein